jgi:hypothetical protein
MKKQHGRELTPVEMAEMLDEFVNSHDYDPDRAAFVEKVVFGTHRTLQQGIMRYFVALVEKYASLKEGEFDGRNEHTVKLARKLVDGTGDKYDRYLPTI